jgi:hypothetical protein
MTNKQFVLALKRLGIDNRLAMQLFRADYRTITRWRSGSRSISNRVAIIVRLLESGKVLPGDILALDI